MKVHMQQASAPPPEPVAERPDEAVPFLDKWQERGAKPYFLDGDYCLIREVRHPASALHGNHTFGELRKVTELWSQSDLSHPLSSKGLEAEDLFFFDTETTGLGGGAGNTIFLLGYAFISGEEIIVRQHILPRPGNEVPLYQSFLEQVNYDTLVTYNGKAFDWPQLKTRHTLVKDRVPKLPEFGHFDLYHASRRLWKNKLERVKLSAVETDILGFKREHDIPGYLAPMIYFDFVERTDPDILFGVLEHNELDVLSLITLYVHLSHEILQTAGYGETSLEIARWLGSLGEKEQAKTAYEQIMEAGSKEDRIAASHAVAFQKKREGCHEEALAIWLQVADEGNSRHRAEAAIECAKLYEHQFRDYQKAAAFTEKAYEALSASGEPPARQQADLHKRLVRLKSKQAKQYLTKKNS